MPGSLNHYTSVSNSKKENEEKITPKKKKKKLNTNTLS